MPKICYVPKNFNAKSMGMIDTANKIIRDYVAQGFVLTLRQLYYQFVSRDILPNTQKSYKNLGSLINDARLAGLIDWNHVEDRTRNVRSLAHWSSPREIVNACAGQFRFDKWAKQDYRPEVWIEKDALVGVIEGICNELDIPYFSCRGYTSQSEMWAGAQRLLSYTRQGQKIAVFHLGDHDPSGKDMTRDIRERLELFTDGKVKLERLALNMDQVRQYNPPPNPAKTTDSRFAGYIAEFGEESWELDALEPRVIVELIRSSVLEIRDGLQWELDVADEEDAKGQLSAVSSRWDDVTSYLEAS